MPLRQRIHVLAPALLALALAAAPAAAQDAPSSPPASGDASASVSDAKLEAFAGAAAEVQGVVQAMRPKIAAAGSQEEGRELMEQANEQIEATIEEHPGITFQEYRQIAAQARQDPEFKARIDGMIRQRLEAGSEGD